MTRSEILQIAKPILFNTDMVQAIQDGRKTVRRVIKLKYSNTHHEIFTNKYGTRLIEIQNDVEGETFGKREDGTTWRKLRGYIEPKPPYKKGDYLYARETWTRFECHSCEGDYSGKCAKSPDKYNGCFMYRETDEIWGDAKWHPSIHMPKEAARIFLRVTDVRAERLQDITDEQARAEGFNSAKEFIETFPQIYPECTKESWVWVIEFERVEVE